MKKSISEIKKEFAMADSEMLPALCKRYAEDERAGVAGLIAQYQKKLERLDAERSRLDAMRDYERRYAGYGVVCGIDEAG